VDLYGRKDTTSGWSLIAQNDTHEEETLCYGGDLECETFVLMYEAFLSYRYYLANVSFLDDGGDGTEVGKQSVGDVGWEVISYDTGFSRLQIAFRIVFLIIGLALLSAFVYRVRQFSIDDLCFEQRYVVVVVVVFFCRLLCLSCLH
jgi:hypothetical protein